MNPAEFTTLALSENDLWWFRGMKRILFDLLDPLAAGNKPLLVMEAGAGTGHMACVLRERYGWRMFATELSWEGVRRTPQREGVLPVQANIEACPFLDSTFDAVVSLDVLVHFPRGLERQALREFARVLKPGGRLILRVSALDVLRSRHSEFCHELQRFTRRRLIQAVSESGFQVLRCTYANSILLPVALARFRVWEPLMGSPVASGTAPGPSWLDQLLNQPLKLESALISRGWNLPAGQSLILLAVKP